MNVFGKKGNNANLNESIGLTNLGNQFWNLSPSELIEDSIVSGQGVLTDTGALAIETGEFTGDLQRIALLFVTTRLKMQFGGVISILNFHLRSLMLSITE